MKNSFKNLLRELIIMFSQWNKINMKAILPIILIMIASFQVFAVDKSIYYGSWKGKVGDESISLNLSKNKIAININSKNITQPIGYEYSYSKQSPYPFLSISFKNNSEAEHLIYLVIGTETKSNKVMLRGFYENTQIIPDSHGKLKTKSNKIELFHE